MHSECCVCLQTTNVVARRVSSGIMCENGHVICKECLCQIRADRPVEIKYTGTIDHEIKSYSILTRQCPMCRCAMVGSGRETVKNMMRVVAQPDRPEGVVAAEILFRWAEGKHGHCVDPLQDAIMHHSVGGQLNTDELVQIGNRLLLGGMGMYAERVYALCSLVDKKSVRAVAGDMEVVLTNCAEVAQWAALHGSYAGYYNWGTYLVNQFVLKSGVKRSVLARGIWYVHRAASRHVINAILEMAFAASLGGNDEEAYRWVSKITPDEWTATVGMPIVIFQAKLAFKLDKWGQCIRCMLACSDQGRSWYIIGQSLQFLERQKLSDLTLTQRRAMHKVEHVMSKVRRRSSSTRSPMVLVENEHTQSLKVFFYGVTTSCVKCMKAAADIIGELECNWAIRDSGQEQIPIQLYRMAATNGCVASMEKLAFLFVYCPYVAPRLKEAKVWLKRALLLGSKTAGACLGILPGTHMVRCAKCSYNGDYAYGNKNNFSRRQLMQKWWKRKCLQCVRDNEGSPARLLSLSARKAYLIGLSPVYFYR